MHEGVLVLGPEIEKTAAEWAAPGRFIPRIVAVASRPLPRRRRDRRWTRIPDDVLPAIRRAAGAMRTSPR